jgi:hypothetical protein
MTTRKQREDLYSRNAGCGWLIYKSAENEITEIEIYVSRDNRVRRISGELLLPIEIIDEGNNTILAS